VISSNTVAKSKADMQGFGAQLYFSGKADSEVKVE